MGHPLTLVGFMAWTKTTRHRGRDRGLNNEPALSPGVGSLAFRGALYGRCGPARLEPGLGGPVRARGKRQPGGGAER